MTTIGPTKTDERAAGGRSRADVVRRYGVAVLAVVLAALLRWGLQPIMGAAPPYITFYLAIVVAAAAGGLGPGLLATALGAIFGIALAVPPLGNLTLHQPAEQVRLAIYLCTGVGISLIARSAWLARHRAQAQAQRVGRVLESMGDAYLLLDRDWRISDMNPQAEHVLRRGRGELIGQELWHAFPKADAFRVVYERAMASRRAERVEAFYAPLEIWFDVHAVPAEGGLALFFRDITERKHGEAALRASEQRYRTLFETIDEGFCVIELIFDEAGRPIDYRFLETNPAFERHSGLVDPVGKTARQLVPDLDEFWFETYGRAALSGEPVRFENHAPAMDRWFDVHASRIGGDGSRRVALLFSDITRRKLAEEDLKAAKLAAEQAQRSAEDARHAAEDASRAKDHFLAVLSHELRTPLTPVLTTADMLEKDPQLPYRYRDDLAMIRRNVELEARLIDDLLDVTRIARGKIELDRRPVELCDVVRRAVEVCRPDIAARRLHFSVDIGPDAPYTINADPARLQQVFWNLLKNAVKFTPPDGHVSLRCRRDSKGYVIAEVIDTGEGIDPALLPHIFKAFEQGGRQTTRQFGGLGLGLTITKGLVEMHGGAISAHSAGKGQGTTIRIRLPLVATPARLAGGTTAPRPAAIPRPPQPPLRILLVEDHGDTARIMQRLLMLDGHHVETAGDVATALDLASNGRAFDLLISDLGLPDGSGVELMRELRARGNAITAIALSGYGQEDDIRRTREAGFAAHLTKPTTPDRLAEVIASVANRP